MPRPPHGGTTRPGPARPGNGYGRALRIWPREIAAEAGQLDPPGWRDPEGWRADGDETTARYPEHA